MATCLIGKKLAGNVEARASEKVFSLPVDCFRKQRLSRTMIKARASSNYWFKITLLLNFKPIALTACYRKVQIYSIILY